MRKLAGLAAAMTLSLVLSACAAGNNGINNQNGVGSNIGTRRMSTGQNNIINNNISYRDGIYTGYGNDHSNGNERAIVEIRNGRIVNVSLISVGPNGTTNNTSVNGGTNISTPGTGLNNQTGTNMSTGTNMGIGNNTASGNNMMQWNNPTNALRNTPGTTTDDMTGNTTGDRTADITGNTTTNVPSAVPRNAAGNGAVNVPSNTPANMPNNINGNTVGYGNNNINSINGYNGTGTGVNMGTTLDGVRNTLANLVIQHQTSNVNYTGAGTAYSDTISNWKLAISRALSQARR